MNFHWLRRLVLLLIGALGTTVFAFFLMLTFHTPQWVENFGANFIKTEVSKRVNLTINALQPDSAEGAIQKAAAALYKNNEAEINRIKQTVAARVNARMADAIAEIRNLDCECRARWQQWLDNGSETQIGLLQMANQQITNLIQSQYARVVTNLKLDIRIFTGTNAAMFLLVLGVALLKPRATTQLFVPALLMVVATLVCSYFYIFEQNWLLTIIYNKYLGLAYLSYLAMVFALLCDIVLNKARVTTNLINSALSAIGSATPVLPC